MKTIIFTYEDTPQDRKNNIQNTLQLLNLAESNVHVGGTNTIQNFLDILTENKDSDLLLLEDDVIPCSEFYYQLNKVIKPKIINRLFTYSISNRGFNTFDMYCGMQCVYIPQSLIETLIEKCNWVLENREDIVERNDYEKVLQFLDGVFYTPEVNYVQTLDTDSTIFNSHTSGSPLFVDDL